MELTTRKYCLLGFNPPQTMRIHVHRHYGKNEGNRRFFFFLFFFHFLPPNSSFFSNAHPKTTYTGQEILHLLNDIIIEYSYNMNNYLMEL